MFDFYVNAKTLSLELSKELPEDMTTEQALLLSIEKWKMIAVFVEAGIYVNDGGLDTCALCHKFRHEACKGCPVAMAGAFGCGGTPYDAYNEALEHEDDVRMLEAAQAEVEFLEDLMEQGGEYLIRLGYGPLTAVIHVEKASDEKDAFLQIQSALADMIAVIDPGEETFAWEAIIGDVSLNIDFDPKKLNISSVEAV